jgi:hypothetical protein
MQRLRTWITVPVVQCLHILAPLNQVGSFRTHSDVNAGSLRRSSGPVRPPHPPRRQDYHRHPRPHCCLGGWCLNRSRIPNLPKNHLGIHSQGLKLNCHCIILVSIRCVFFQSMWMCHLSTMIFRCPLSRMVGIISSNAVVAQAEERGSSSAARGL